MGGGGWFSLIPTLPDFAGEGLRSLTGGATAKERKNFITDTRKLRKHQYQDMVYSLTEAGLNPVLAVGASPGGTGGATSGSYAGHSGSAGVAQGMGSVSSATAANRQAGVSEKLSDSKEKEQLANALLRSELSGNAVAERANIQQRLVLDAATIDQVRATTRAQTALSDLYKQQAIEKGASASKLNKETSMYNEYGAPWATAERMLLELLRPAANSAKGAIGQFLDYGKPKEPPPSGRWGDQTWKRRD